MKSFARSCLASIVLAFGFVLEAFWTLVGLIAVTIGTSKIYVPAGWIVGGLLLIAASEFRFSPRKKSPRVSGGDDGAL